MSFLKECVNTVYVVILLIFLFPGAAFVGCFFTVYVLFYTRYWTIALAYLFWIFFIDKNRADSGTRRSQWVCSWSIFKYAANYFPITFTTEPGFSLNPKRNYIAAVFPHGAISIGAYLGLQTNAIGINKRLPHHTMHGGTLEQFFYLPLMREVLMLVGICSVAAETIGNILKCKSGGKIVGIVVGGVAEAIITCVGQYRLVLRNRKGFAKLALKNGSPLIPVFAFGETSVYGLKVLLKKSLFLPFAIPYGRGLFKCKIGMIPNKTPINIVAGLPIEVEKVENPTQQQIDELHALFIQKLTELFEEYKYKFEENPEQVKLVIT